MAKVLILSRYWDSELERIIHSLVGLNANLTMCLGELPKSNLHGLPQLHPFKNWSFTEALLLTPTLLRSSFQAVHFFFQKDEVPSPAHHFLAQFYKVLQKKMVVSQDPTSPAFAGSTNSVWARSALKTKFASCENLEDQVSQELKLFVKKMRPFALIPDSVEKFYQDAQILSPHLRSNSSKLKFLFLKSPQSSTALPNISYVPQNEIELQYLFSKSQAALLAFSELGSAQLQAYKSMMIFFKIPLVISPWQKEKVPGLVRDLETGWVLETGLMQFLSLLMENPTLQIDFQAGFEENQSQRDFDLQTNRLSRLYEDLIPGA